MDVFRGHTMLGMTTNWSKFSQEMKLDDNVANEVLHLPIYCNFAEPTSIISGAVIFRPKANRTAMMFVGSQAYIDYIENSDMLEKPCLAKACRAV